ncbi:MAG TPA: hypothetical protein VFK05_10685 [Polyangiaceae bacterium]|nr:hypothetical protein [Polyangiaceae bacterium]
MKKINAVRLLISFACALGTLAHLSTARASCTEGCGSYSSSSACWCDTLCSNYGDCCVDYAAQCLAPPTPICPTSRTWRASTLLQARPPGGFLSRTYPDVGIAADGTAIAIWQWTDFMPSGFRGVRARRFARGSFGGFTFWFWTAATDIATGTALLSSSSPARVAVGSGGHAFVTLPTGDLVRYLPSSGWSSLSSSGLPATRTSFARAVDAAGALMYLYESSSSLQVARRGGYAWETPDFLGTSTPSPDLASNSSGDFGAIFDPSYAYVMRRDEAEGGGFTARATHLSCSNGRVGIADDGTVLGVWFGSPNTVQFARLNTASITAPIDVAAYASGALFNLRLAVNGAGQAIASWLHAGSLGYEVIAALYAPSTGWSAPTTLAASAVATLGGLPNLEVGIDGCGGAHLVHEDIGYKGYAFDYLPGVGWGTRYTFTGPVLFPRIATAADGVATVVWDNDQNEVLAARFE